MLAHQRQLEHRRAPACTAIPADVSVRACSRVGPAPLPPYIQSRLHRECSVRRLPLRGILECRSGTRLRRRRDSFCPSCRNSCCSVPSDHCRGDRIPRWDTRRAVSAGTRARKRPSAREPGLEEAWSRRRARAAAGAFRHRRPAPEADLRNALLPTDSSTDAADRGSPKGRSPRHSIARSARCSFGLV